MAERAAPAPGGNLRRVVSNDGTEIVLERASSGARDVVLVSGGPTTRARWAAVAALLDGTLSCWLMDRRGKGDSGDTSPYSFEREHEDLAAAVASFDHPVILGGHSSGALCVLGAAQRGTPTAALILYEPPWPLTADHTPLERVAAIEQLIDAGDRDGALEIAFRDLVGMPAPAIEAFRAAPVWSEYRSLAHTWPREMREIARGSVGHHPTGRHPRSRPPARRHHLAPHHRRSTAALAAALPAATVVELPGHGHGALDTGPDLVAAAILAFTRNEG